MARRRDVIKAVSGTALLGLTAGCMAGEGPAATETGTPTEEAAATDTPVEQETPTETPAETETETEAEETSTGTGSGDLADVNGEVASTVGNLSVTNHELYRANGEVALRGTVENTGDQAFGYVEAEVTLQDDEGDVLYEFIDETEEEDVARLEPGNTWQFDVAFQEAQMSEVTGYSIEIDGFPASEDLEPIEGELDNQDPNLEILNSHLTRQDSQMFVAGSVKNVGDQAIETVEVSVTLYENQTNSLADFTRTVEEEEDLQQLPPGQIWEFKVDFQDIDLSSVARYTVTADSTLA